MSVRIEAMAATDWPAVSEIYREGIATGHATFAPAPPGSFEDFSDGKIMECGCVARGGDGRVIGWATLAKVSDRCVYAGVAEVSVYVAAKAEAAEVWTLQAGIFPENTASLALHARHGFREVGRRERLGKMPAIGPRAGQWRDVLLLERRSAVAGV
jgi:L-amino acid N-acyltransferase YncA